MNQEVLDRLTPDFLRSICERWQIREFAVFGSVLRDDFSSDSDVDLLLSFEDSAPWSLWELYDLRVELEAVLGRKVDIVEPEAIRNPYRQKSILGSKKVIYRPADALISRGQYV